MGESRSVAAAMSRSPMPVPIAAIVVDRMQSWQRGDMKNIELLSRHDAAGPNLTSWNAAIHCALVAAYAVEVSSR
jgi:hypothetical protein